MLTPKYVNVINVSKHPIPLETHNNSVQIQNSHSVVKVLYEFITWAPLPKGIIIDSYILADGSQVKTLDQPVAPEPNDDN